MSTVLPSDRVRAERAKRRSCTLCRILPFEYAHDELSSFQELMDEADRLQVISKFIDRLA
jgi:hypothetical protein